MALEGSTSSGVLKARGNAGVEHESWSFAWFCIFIPQMVRRKSIK